MSVDGVDDDVDEVEVDDDEDDEEEDLVKKNETGEVRNQFRSGEAEEDALEEGGGGEDDDALSDLVESEIGWLT